MCGPSGPPQYKGEPLDAERGPGLGCFWIQVVTLGVLLVLLAIPFALMLGPLIIGAIVLAYGLRIAHVGLASAA